MVTLYSAVGTDCLLIFQTAPAYCARGDLHPKHTLCNDRRSFRAGSSSSSSNWTTEECGWNLVFTMWKNWNRERNGDEWRGWNKNVNIQLQLYLEERKARKPRGTHFLPSVARWCCDLRGIDWTWGVLCGSEIDIVRYPRIVGAVARKSTADAVEMNILMFVFLD